jgi:carbon storage regulator
MLVLSRKKNESIVIGDAIISVIEIRGDKVRLGIVCPRDYSVHRQEVYEVLHGMGPPERRPSTPEERAFLQAIEESPEDQANRLIFADWLEERGDPLGQFLRIQCDLETLSAEDDRCLGLKGQKRALWQEHGASWLVSLPQVLWR